MAMTKFQILSRAAAWLLALAIVLLSVVPPSIRPTVAPSYALAHVLEHLLAFLAIGLAFGVAYPRRGWTLTGALVAFTGAIEVVQLWVPGRHARISDFLLDATALCIGMGLSRILLDFIAARFPHLAVSGRQPGEDGPAG
jgi:VanZ family protein